MSKPTHSKSTEKDYQEALVSFRKKMQEMEDGMNQLKAQMGRNVLPKGCILMVKHGNIPPGFVLCNGQYGTPDLRDKFIMSSISSKSGGSLEHNHGNSSRVNVVDWAEGRNQHLLSTPIYSYPGGDSSNLPPYVSLMFVMKL